MARSPVRVTPARSPSPDAVSIEGAEAPVSSLTSGLPVVGVEVGRVEVVESSSPAAVSEPDVPHAGDAAGSTSASRADATDRRHRAPTGAWGCEPGTSVVGPLGPAHLAAQAVLGEFVGVVDDGGGGHVGGGRVLVVVDVDADGLELEVGRPPVVAIDVAVAAQVEVVVVDVAVTVAVELGGGREAVAVGVEHDLPVVDAVAVVVETHHLRHLALVGPQVDAV